MKFNFVSCYLIYFLSQKDQFNIECSVIKDIGEGLKGVKTGFAEKAKELLRKVVYGITPTTPYTTMKAYKFPEEYDPIKILEAQLYEEKRRGITTPDYEPKLTDKTNLWDGYFNDYTFEGRTLWCQRHLHVNDSLPTTIKKYWDPTFGHEKSIEELAKYWKKEALKENEEWWRKRTTEQPYNLEDNTLDVETGVKYSANWGESHWDSEDRRLLTQGQKDADELYEKEWGHLKHLTTDVTHNSKEYLDASFGPQADKDKGPPF